jgi:hypothetical protein
MTVHSSISLKRLDIPQKEGEKRRERIKPIFKVPRDALEIGLTCILIMPVDYLMK